MAPTSPGPSASHQDLQRCRLEFGSYASAGSRPHRARDWVTSSRATPSLASTAINIRHDATTSIEGNIIGAELSGEHAAPNRNWGVPLADVSLVTVGGTAAGAGNLISGNNATGSVVYIDGSTGDTQTWSRAT